MPTLDQAFGSGAASAGAAQQQQASSPQQSPQNSLNSILQKYQGGQDTSAGTCPTCGQSATPAGADASAIEALV